MKVGYYQFSPKFGKPSQNLERIRTALSGVKADIIVLPELAFTGYYFKDREELRSMAEDISESSTVESLSNLCKDNNFYVVTGFAEQEKDKLYNSALLIGPSGVVHCYRKLHLFNTEKEYFDPGDTPLDIVEIRGAKVGLMICFDWVFPEVARTLALRGADLICHPANLVLTFCQKAMLTRCIENSVFAVTANRTGTEIRPRGKLAFTGQSQIVGPKGEIIVKSNSASQELILCKIDIDSARNKSITDNNDLLIDRRPEYYTALVER
ncbi:MAG: acyltransferase [Deltaproteobacteria bacterium]|nr:acyltransferase [Deltaproteobacteria bacterium]